MFVLNINIFKIFKFFNKNVLPFKNIIEGFSFVLREERKE